MARISKSPFQSKTIAGIVIVREFLGVILRFVTSAPLTRPKLRGPLILLALLPCCRSYAGPVEASYIVQRREGSLVSGGSGVAISERHLVTCSHVVDHKRSTNLEVLDRSGRKWIAQCIGGDPNADIAIVEVSTGPPLEYVAISESDPMPGQTVAHWGFGTNRRLEGGEGIVQPANGTKAGGTPVVGTNYWTQRGDSGSGVFNERGELVAITWGGDEPPPFILGKGPSLNTPASAVRTLYQRCIGGECPTPITRPMVPVRRPAPTVSPVQPTPDRPDLIPGPEPWQPIAQQPTRCDCPKCQPAAQQPAQPTCDLTPVLSQLAALEAKIAAIKPIPGPQGPPGPAGDNGLAGPPGQQGKACDCQPSVATGEVEHIVVVADKASPDYRRLSGLIADAKAHYSGVRVSDLPPFPIGTIPQLVVYKGGVPQKVYKGRREVEEILSRVRREEFPERF